MKTHPSQQIFTDLLLIWLLACASTSAQATYLDDIGYIRLKSEQGVNTPDGNDVPVTQVEASTSGTGNPPLYMPDITKSEFQGKVITDMSGSAPGTYSAHATTVGSRFYGNNSSVVPGISSIQAFHADHWLQAGLLQFGSNDKPLPTSSRVANHSWVGSTSNPADDSDLLRRTDWLVETDEAIQCVGILNGFTGNWALMSSAYNVIAVGKSNGLNGYGTPQLDTEYVSGRARPELVAPLLASSSATPVAASTAALLVGVGHTRPYLSTDPVETYTSNRNGDTIYNAERSEVIKAVLMAGADRLTTNGSSVDITDYRADPSFHTDNGLDIRYGAGQLNVYNSYHILAAGEQNSDEDDGTGPGNIGATGFDYDPSFGDSGNSTASYYFSTGTGTGMLSATLAWNIDIDGGNGPFFSGNAELHDLDIYLFDITAGTVLLESSASSIDNTETIWTVLSPERDYLLQVTPKSGQDPFDWDYALAWQIVELIDTDGDGIVDIYDTDDDNDGLSDDDEITAGTNPVNPDSDGDLVIDGTEVLAGTDPMNIADYPEMGDINGDGVVDTADTLLATRAATGIIMLDDSQLARGNVAPLVNGIPQSLPDDAFNAADLLLIMRKALGAVNF